MSSRVNLRFFVSLILMLVALICAIRPRLHAFGVAIGLFSLATFLALAYLVGGFNEALARVVHIDQVALGLLAIGAILLWLSQES